ncbi:hypothetical protein AB6884_10345 [Carnobacterium maltaromaticum]
MKIENRLIQLINQLKMKSKAFLFELNLIITGSINSEISSEKNSVKIYG